MQIDLAYFVYRCNYVSLQFITGGREIEMDGIALNGEVKGCAIHEHVENAGVHSGDATLMLPVQVGDIGAHSSLPFSLSIEPCSSARADWPRGCRYQ